VAARMMAVVARMVQVVARVARSRGRCRVFSVDGQHVDLVHLQHLGLGVRFQVTSTRCQESTHLWQGLHGCESPS